MPLSGEAVLIALAAAVLWYGGSATIHGVKKGGAAVVHKLHPAKPAVKTQPPKQ